MNEENAALKAKVEELESEIMYILSMNGEAIAYLDDQTPERCWAAIENDCEALRYIREPTVEMCIYAVKNNGFMLEEVPDEYVTVDFVSSVLDGEENTTFMYSLERRNLWTKEIALVCMEKYPDITYRYLPEELKKDPEISNMHFMEVSKSEQLIFNEICEAMGCNKREVADKLRVFLSETNFE